MKQLSKLSPSETLLVLKDKNASIKELLKVTFMDLLLKQVVRTIEVQRQYGNGDTIRVYKYVVPGKNFLTYKPQPHEYVFLSPFQTNNNIRILFRHIVKLGYQKAKSENNFHNILRKNPTINKCFSRNIIQSIIGGFNITSEGLELRKEIQFEITQLEKTLPPLISQEPEKALDILKLIKGNIFLLTNIEFELLNQIDKELLAELNTPNGNSIDGGFTGCTWDSFDNYSDQFDSSCSGDSGCSGCNGSGCSGCGGD